MSKPVLFVADNVCSVNLDSTVDSVLPQLYWPYVTAKHFYATSFKKVVSPTAFSFFFADPSLVDVLWEPLQSQALEAGQTDKDGP